MKTSKLGAAACFVVFVFLGACASQPPYRPNLETPPASCDPVFATPDAEGVDWDGDCWKFSYERHPDYELHYVEFDDHGWLGGTAEPSGKETQLSRLKQRLTAFHSGQGADGRPINLIVYTHGWHHSAKAGDQNVIDFRKLLRGTAAVEKHMCLLKRAEAARRAPSAQAKPGECEIGENVEPWLKRRHVVGVYVGWRGDSILGPHDFLSVWDRKLAAEQVALGSVQELYSYLHDFYLANRCKVPKGATPAVIDEARNCADVRMLVTGHSFGGLITFRSLAPRLMSGLVEQYRSGDSSSSLKDAYSFGDLTVLVNPAFEGTRYEPIARAAAERQYNVGENGRKAQLPVLVVLNSDGDWATGYTFPIFRTLTTLLEDSEGELQHTANVKTVGWNERYRTHWLSRDPAPNDCGLAWEESHLGLTLVAETAWWERQRAELYRPFGAAELRLCNQLLLKQVADPSELRLDRPPFLPFWVIQTDKAISKDHNDYVNRHLADFVRQVYYTVLRERDVEMVEYLRRTTAGRKP